MNLTVYLSGADIICGLIRRSAFILKKIMVMCVIVFFTLIFSGICFAEEQVQEKRVPTEAIQLLIDDSTDIISTYKTRMFYHDWRSLYYILIKDEGRFSQRYPNSKYAAKIKELILDFNVIDENWNSYMQNIHTNESRETIRVTIESVEKHRNELAQILNN